MLSIIFPHESYSGAAYLRKWFMHLDILDCHFFERRDMQHSLVV